MPTRILISDRRRDWDRLRRDMRVLRDEAPRIKIGLFGRQGSALVKKGSINEFGATIRNEEGRVITIPERSFLRATIIEKHQDIIEKVQIGIGLFIDGRKSLDHVLKAIGFFTASLVKRKITLGPFKPNAPLTIRKKGSSRPLIDTARMRNSVTHEID